VQKAKGKQGEAAGLAQMFIICSPQNLGEATPNSNQLLIIFSCPGFKDLKSMGINFTNEHITVPKKFL
jgi:hypothetical protein